MVYFRVRRKTGDQRSIIRTAFEVFGRSIEFAMPIVEARKQLLGAKNRIMALTQKIQSLGLSLPREFPYRSKAKASSNVR